MALGFFGKGMAVDEHDTLGGIPSTNRDYFVYPTKSTAGVSVGLYFFNLQAVANPNPDQESIVSSTLISYTGNKILVLSAINTQRGYRYTTNTVRLLQKNKIVYLDPNLIVSIALAGSPSDRSDFINVDGYKNLTSFIAGSSPGSAGQGTTTNFKGIKGKFSRLIDFWVVPISTGNLNLMTEIERRFPATLERFQIRATNVAGVIMDRISECVNLKTFYVGVPDGANAYFQNAPYSSYAGGGSSIPLSGTIDLSNKPLLEEIFLQGTFTSLLLHPSCVFKFFQVYSSTSVSATELRTALNLALSSATLYKFYAHSNALTWTRAFTNSDFASTLVDFYIYNNSITGNITLTATRPNILRFRTGILTNRTGQQQNSHPTIDLSGLTGALLIDLSGSDVSNLQLPTNTSMLQLYLQDNFLDITVNTDLISKVAAMTLLQDLRFSDSVNFSGVHKGQASTNGLGANVNLSALINATQILIAECKLTGTLTVASVNKLITFDVSRNAITSIVNISSHVSIATFRAIECPNLTVNINFLTSIQILQASKCTFTTFNLTSKTTTGDVLALDLRECIYSDGTVTLPNVSGRFRLGSNASIRISDSASFTTLVNADLITVVSINSSTGFTLINCSSFNQAVPLGEGGFTVNAIALQNNAMNQSNVDATVNYLHTNRKKWDVVTVVSKSFNIAGAGNAAASGTYQAPSGYKSQSITGITKAATAVVTVSAIGSLANNDVIRIRSVVGMTQVNNQYYMIKNISGNTFELYTEDGLTPINSTAFGTYTSGGFAQVEGTPASAKEQIYVLVNVYQWTITYN